MKLNKQTVQSFVTVAALLLALVAGVFGVKLPEVPDYPDLSSVISVQEFGAGGEGLRAGVRERISIDAREDVYLYNGADLYMYSDDHGTQTIKLDGGAGTLLTSGDWEINGTTPFLTIGDAGEEDAGLLFDGAAQDFYCALDDSADDLVCGLGSAVGTTPILSMDEAQGVTFGGTVDVNGNAVYIGADQGQYIDELADDVVVWQQGAGTGVVQFLTGNVVVGNGNPNPAQDGEDLYVESNLEVDGTIYADGMISSTAGDVTVNDDLSVSNRLIFAYNQITVTSGLEINPSAVYHRLNAAGAVTMTLGTSTAEDGQIVILVGMDDQTITINDTNVLTSDGSTVALAQYDVIMFVYDSELAKWLEVSHSTNS